MKENKKCEKCQRITPHVIYTKSIKKHGIEKPTQQYSLSRCCYCKTKNMFMLFYKNIFEFRIIIYAYNIFYYGFIKKEF